MSDFSSELASIGAIPQNGVCLRFIYRGLSMKPTFSPGQIIHVNSQAQLIVPGDVIVYKILKTQNRIVHRVISLSKNSYITRGDNNLENDCELILPAQIIGRVEKKELKGNFQSVSGGWRGLLRARILRINLLSRKVIRKILGKPYFWLKSTGIIAKIWKPKIIQIHFQTKDGPLVKYLHKGRTVARHWMKTNNWQYLRPYDFVIGPMFRT